MRYRFLLLLSALFTAFIAFGESNETPKTTLNVFSPLCTIAAVLSHIDVSCYGASDGEIRLRDVEALGIAEFSIDNGLTWQEDSTFLGLSAQSYSVLIREQADHSCSVVLDAAFVITQPAQLSALVTKENISCFSLTDGEITVNNPTGGSGTYEYSKNGIAWQDSPVFDNLTMGSYSIRLRDKLTPGCMRVLPGSYVIARPAQMTSLVSTDEITCNGAANGAIYFKSNKGGSGVYNFSINNGLSWQTDSSFTNLSGGTYVLRIQDANNPGCIRTIGSVNLVEPTPMVASFTKNDANCYGVANGSISVNVSGSYTNYLFSKNGGLSFEGSGADNHVFTNLAKGSYSLAVKVGNISPACLYTFTDPVIIDEPDQIIADVIKTNANCFGVSNGSIEFVNISGGSGAYEYRIRNTSSWVSTPLNSNLAAGNYNVRIRDANSPSCVVILNNSLTITQPVSLGAQIATVPNTCFQTNNGQITLSNSVGGTQGNYEYTINGGANWSNTTSYPNLPAGTYNIRIRDKDVPTCTRVLSSNLKILEPAELKATIEYTNPNCFGESNGRIIIKNQSGRPDLSYYSYSIDGGVDWNIEDTITNLPAGNYDVWMKDQFSTCAVRLNASLNLIQPAVLGATFSKSDLTCFGDSSGSIQFTNLVGGTGRFNFSIDGGNTWSKNALLDNLDAGNYHLMIRDSLAKKCTKSINSNVVLSQPAELQASISNNLIECNGDATGEIVFSNYSGGNPPYLFSIDNGANWQTSPFFFNLTSNTYQAIIKDPVCENYINNALVINENPKLDADIIKEDITCYGNSTGKITLRNPVGGNGTSYQYSIDGGFSWNTYGGSGDFVYDNLIAGNYILKMKDAACIVPLASPLTINQVDPLAASFDKIDVTCFAAADGKITFKNVTGGSGIYEYRIRTTGAWSSNPSFNSLQPGTYQLHVRDFVDPTCILSLGSLVINEPSKLNVSINKTNTDCNGKSNGQIEFLNPSGGHGSYEFSIDGGVSWSALDHSNLTIGNYQVFMRDADTTSCIVNLGIVTIGQPAVLDAIVEVDTVTCFGGSNGKLTVTNMTGGSGLYEFSFDNQNTWTNQPSQTNLPQGIYQVFVRDASANSCVRSLGSHFIKQPTAISFTTSQTNQTCFGGNSGAIQFNANGGSGTYIYSIDNGLTWSNAPLVSSLTQGTYQVKVADKQDNACQVTGSPVLITEPAAIQVQAVSKNTSCNSALDGELSLTITGGTGPFEYSINNGVTWSITNPITGLGAANYQVLARELSDNSCIGSSLVVAVQEPKMLDATFSTSDVTCNAGMNGVINITKAITENRNLEYSTDNGLTWQSNSLYTTKHAGVYNVFIRNADTTSCVKFLGQATIDQPAPLFASTELDSVTCFGGSNGKLTVTNMTGGSGLYEFSFDNQNTWTNQPSQTNLPQGIYQVFVRDASANSCVRSLGSHFIKQPTAISFTTSQTNQTCFGGNSGAIQFNANGGSGTYIYSIDNGLTWSNAPLVSSLTQGTYQVKVADKQDNACQVTGSPVLITEPAAIQVQAVSKNTSCNSALDGELSLTITGGTGPFEYSINNGVTWSITNPITGLGAANYQVLARELSDNSCIGSSLVVAVQEPKMLDATFSTSDVTCNAGMNGVINITKAITENRNLEYSTDNGLTWQSNSLYTTKHAGVYNVFIRNADTTSCVKFLGQATIDQPAPLFASTELDSVTCFGGSNGNITVSSVTGGSGQYEYSFDNGISWGSNSKHPGLTSGDYTVTMRDKDDVACTLNLGMVTITQPTQITSTATVTNATCSGTSSGSISMQSFGGSGQYEYSIDNGSNWRALNKFDNLSVGMYAIEVRDVLDNACILVVNSIEVTEPDPLQVLTIANPVDCYGKSSGSIEANVTGGTGPYEYSIDNGTSWVPFTPFLGLKKGTYQIMARELNTSSCIATSDPVNIIEPLQLDAGFSSTDVTCYSANDGSIILINGVTETRKLEYSIDNGSTWSATNLFSGLSEGTYPVSIRNADTTSCFRTIGQAIISQPAQLSAVVVANPVTCFGESNGDIIVSSVSGGSGNYEYSFDSGLSWGINTSVTSLGVGNYVVILRDANNITCSSNLGTVVISEPAEIIVNHTVTDATCFGTATGEINLAATGGSNQFEYSLDNPVQWTSSTQFDKLSAGNYTILVRDVNEINCIASSGILTVDQPGIINALVSKSDIGCSGTPKGSIQLSAITGGSGVYEYSYDNKMTWVSSTQADNLNEGLVSISIRDLANPLCVIDLSDVEIDNYEIKLDVPQITQISCFDKSDGVIQLTNVNGGTSSDFEYSIDGGINWQTASTFMGLNKGSYDIIIRNTSNTTCFKELSDIVIEEPEELSVQGFLQEITCDEKGAIYLENPSGSVSGLYEFSIDGTNWSDQLEFTNLDAGFYSLNIRDASNITCSRIIDSNIEFRDVSKISGYITNKSDVNGCVGASNGSIEVWADKGYDQYQFSIFDGTSWSDFTTDIYNNITPCIYNNLGVGTYRIKIQDPNDLACAYTIPDEIVISHPNVILPATVSLDYQISVCNTSDSLVITAQTSHVTNYSWQLNGADLVDGNQYSGTKTSQLIIKPVTNDFHNKTFVLKVDGNCQPAISSDSIVVKVDQQISSTILGDLSVCLGDKTQPLQLINVDSLQVYNWEVFDLSTQSWQPILESSRKLTMPVFADPDKIYYRSILKNGVCPLVYTDSVEMVFNPLPVSEAGNDTLVQEGATVQLVGTGGINFYWSPGASLSDSTSRNPMAKPNQTTVYYHYVTNEFGCTAVDSVSISVLEETELFIPNTFTPNGDGVNDLWVIRTINQYPTSNIEIFSRWGVQLYQKKNGVIPWDGVSDGKVLPTGTYFYVLKLTPDSKPISGSISIVR